MMTRRTTFKQEAKAVAGLDGVVSDDRQRELADAGVILQPRVDFPWRTVEPGGER